jgi:TolA-binding protein
MDAFAKGDYAKAAASMQTIIDQAAPDSPLETVYYTQGAAYFNQKDFPKAIDALQKFVAKYPKAPKANDATFFIGQGQVELRDVAGAARTLAPLEANPEYRERVELLMGTAFKDAGKLDDAVATLKKLTDGGLRTPAAVNGAMVLAGVYTQQGKPDEAIALMKSVRKRSDLLDNVIRLNAVAIQLGDELLQKDKPEEALACYSIVQSRDELIAQQQDRLASMQKQIDANLVAVRADPTRLPEIKAQNEALQKSLNDTKAQLEKFEKTPDFEGPFLLRVARAYYMMEKRWEAIAVYDELLRRQPTGTLREPALFGLIVASAEANRGTKCRDLAETYLKEFPKGPNANTVGYLLGAVALQSGDSAAAESYFGRMLETQTDSTYREQLRYLLGNARFSLGKFDAAAADYGTYLKDYPQGSFVEDATYRKALCPLFAGKYEEALKQIGEYIKAYPKGQFVADAKYRIDVCNFAASDYDKVIADADAWVKEFPNDPMTGEVLALKADALASIPGREDEAIDTYVASVKAAQSEDVLSHSLTEGAKLMQKQGEWEKIDSVFQEFVKDNPQSPMVVAAAYWIGRAKTKEGKPDEAKEIIAGVIKQNINDPSQAAVEQLLTQLAQLYAKKKAPSADGQPAPDPAAALEAALAGDDASTPTAKARIVFAQSELARLRRDPAGQQKALLDIAAKFKPEDLSPALLAQVGDALLAQKDWDKAHAYFQYLKDTFPKSDFLDFAYNGFGEIAYAKKDYPAALQFFTDAIDKAGATQKLKDVTVGQAKTLLAMGRFEEAKKLFEQIAATREWRGDATAYSIYSLGEIEQKQGKLPEAIAYYQRVYVAYGRYLQWVAKAYINSAECFKKLGKNQEATNTYREMVHNDKLSAFPEYQIARKQLEATGS